MDKILFVCTGNTCRSPMAAALFNKLAKEKKLPVTADSAGIAAQDGDPASLNAVLASKESGAELSRHRAKKVTPELLESAVRVYTMTDSHRKLLQASYPSFNSKVEVLGGGIPDPFGGDLDVYRICRTAILKSLEQILTLYENKQ